MALGWNFNPATGFLLDNGGGSDDYAYIPTDSGGTPKSMPSSSALEYAFVDLADGVGIDVYGSGDLNSAWRITFDATSVYILKRTNGVDAAAATSAVHGLSAATPFTVDVRPGAVNGTTIEVRLNSDPTVVLSYDITPGDSLSGYGGYGFDSATDGARVAMLEVAQLVPTYTARADIPWFVCGGELWCSLDGVGLTLVERRALNGTGLVDGDDLDQIVYLVDGANARKFDPSALTVTKWLPSAGTLPGQTADGTTDATIVTQYVGRVLLNEEQNVFASAVNNALDYDSGVVSAGAAWDFATSFAGKIGQPIKALLRLGKTQLLVGCSRSIWLMRGDLALGAVEIDPIDESVGITGKDAMLRVSDGLALVHTTQGLYVVSGEGTATPLSRTVLTQLITVDTVDTEYAISVCRDVKRSGTLIFLTPITSGPAIHIFYDERTGKFLPPTVLGQRTGGGAGYFPEQYPDRIGPMCAMEFDGRVLMLGRDGYCYTFDDDADTDDGDAIDSFATALVLHEDDLVQGVKLHAIDTMLADWSGAVNLSVYSGQTAQEAYDRSTSTLRTLRRRVQTSASRRRHTIDVSAPFLVVEISGTGSAWGTEAMQAMTSPDVLRRASYRPIPPPPLPCGVTIPSESAPGPGTGPGPGDPAGGGGTKCTACADWMAANTTGTIGGHDGYLLLEAFVGTPGTAFVSSKLGLDTILSADVCDVGPTYNDIVVYAVGNLGTVIIGTGTELAAHSPVSDTSWTLYFRCEDQPGVA